MAMVPESFTFTVGKLDAGMAILLGERAHLIEFPSILLPPGASAGSIVNISVHQNHSEEKRRDEEFWTLQEAILEEFGRNVPASPDLQLRNVTQTSVTLEWPSLSLATAKLRSLDLYRNGQRLAAIPSPMTNTSSKVSGLEVNSEYTFQLILRTTAGTFPSKMVRVRTHTMTDTSGISVCFGNVQDLVLLENAKLALREMNAKWSDKIEIDTTHFVCTNPAATPNGAEAVGNSGSAPGVVYQRALQLSIPIIQPHWILACHSEKKMVPVAPFYLGASPAASASTASFRPQSMSQASLPHQPGTPPTDSSRGSNRASMPPPSRNTTSPPSNVSGFINQPVDHVLEPTPEEPSDDVAELAESTMVTAIAAKRKSRSGTMNREFKFPSPAASPVVSDPPIRVAVVESEENDVKPSVITPSSIEVPPPPPVEKERTRSSSQDDLDDDVGPTVEVDLS